MLQMVESYIAWGYHNLKTISDLVYKRDFGEVDCRRTHLTDKSIIEDAFGKFGIICVEDFIHEIFMVGPQNVY